MAYNNIALWYGQTSEFETRSNWTGTPSPDPRPDADDKVELRAINSAPVIGNSDPTLREISIYKGQNDWGLTVSNNRWLTITDKLVLENTEYGGGTNGTSRLFVEAGSRVSADTIINYGIIEAKGILVAKDFSILGRGELNVSSGSAITAINFNNNYIANVDGHLSGNILSNLPAVVGSHLNFNFGSSLSFNEFYNYGLTNVSEEISIWSFSGKTLNYGLINSFSALTVIETNSVFTSTNRVSFKDVSVRDGAVLSILQPQNEYYSTFSANSVEVDAGATFNLVAMATHLGHLINYGTTLISINGPGVFTEIENYGDFTLRSGAYGTFTNSGHLTLYSGIAGELISLEGSEINFTPAHYNTGQVEKVTIQNGSWFGTRSVFDFFAKGNEILDVLGDSFSSSGGTIIINPVDGRYFSAGETFTLVNLRTASSTLSISDNVNVLKQHKDFAYATGVLAGTNDLVFKPLNSGATGGVGVLDLSSGQTGAEFSSADGASFGSVRGGTFDSVRFASLLNVTSVKGTEFADNMTAYEYGTDAPRSFVFSGMKGDDSLQGARGNDTLNGGEGNDTLSGGKGNDYLYGDAGADALSGGAGADRVSYVTAKSGVTVSLANAALNTGDAAGDTYVSIENISGSTYSDKLYANSAANVINAGAGNDLIKGYAGNDTLSGGAGSDTFVFNSSLNATNNVDTITDFATVDTMQLENGIFTALTTLGTLAVGSFKNLALGAIDSDDRILYSASGKLYYDADGSGNAFGLIKFAELSGVPNLTSSDFFVI